jgi:hypothetical protein
MMGAQVQAGDEHSVRFGEAVNAPKCAGNGRIGIYAGNVPRSSYLASGRLRFCLIVNVAWMGFLGFGFFKLIEAALL